MTRTQRRTLFLLGAAIALLALFTAVLLLLGVGNNSKHDAIIFRVASPTPATATAARQAPPPSATQRPGPTVRTRLGTPVRATPAAVGLLLAELPSGLVLPVAGRSADSAWLLVQFSVPGSPNDQRFGWVTADSVDASGDLGAVPVVAADAATPTPSPSPTPTPTPTPSRTATPAASPTPARTPTAAPGAALPDLGLQDFGIITVGAGAGFLRVDIANYGLADLSAQPIEIAGFDQTGTQVLHLTTGPVAIPAGKFVTITTGYRPTQRTALTVVVNPAHTIAEADAPPGFDDPNNALTKTVTPP